jgi:site-specific recombinase XerD
LWHTTVKTLRAWLRANQELTAEAPLLPNRDGKAMTRSNVAKRLLLAVRTATVQYPRLSQQRVSPHTIRHTTAMHLLQAGVDMSVIALWLGHESPVTTHHYIEANLAMKERALARLNEPDAKIQRYRAPDSLIDFLRTL